MSMPSRYINPYTDFGFKKLFGEEASKALLIDFLNTLLPEQDQVAELTFMNTENLPDSSVSRRAVVDIACTNKEGRQFIVEMQKAKQHFFKDRSLFYLTFPIQRQAVKGDDWNFELKKIYLIGLLNFIYDEEEEKQKFLRDVALRDQDGELFFDKLQIIFLQMPLFKKSEPELTTHKDKWFYFLQNLPSFDEIPAILREPVFEKAFAAAEYAALPLADQHRYICDWMALCDNYAVEETARKDAAAAIAKAAAEGEIRGKAEIARSMKADGVDPAVIAKYSGLSPAEIDLL